MSDYNEGHDGERTVLTPVPSRQDLESLAYQESWKERRQREEGVAAQLRRRYLEGEDAESGRLAKGPTFCNPIVMGILGSLFATLLGALATLTFGYSPFAPRNVPQPRLPTRASSWWQGGMVYQVYPRSFLDSDGDGVGDLEGIIKKLDYIASLNASALWINPIFKSPMRDFGYDVSSYTEVDPLFGNTDDVSRLIKEAHRRSMKVLLDMVPNHTSDMHPWFIDSISSKSSKKRHWYVWEPPASDGGPPNNWLSFFGGSAWTYDPPSNEFFLHQYLEEQPDLNYRNPEVLDAMKKNIEFWLDMGLDGYRLDAPYVLYEDKRLRSEPADPNWHEGDDPHNKLSHIYTQNVKPVHTTLGKIRDLVDSYKEPKVLICETIAANAELRRYYGNRLNECHLPFNFGLVDWDSTWPGARLRSVIKDYLDSMPAGAWPNWVLGNHDNHRIATRLAQQFSSTAENEERAKMANFLLFTLPGTPTIYYGDELAMFDTYVPPDEVVDPAARRQKRSLWDKVGRDPERTPMQWDNSTFAGFIECSKGGEGKDAHVSPGECPKRKGPWLPLSDDYEQRNVELQSLLDKSPLTLTRAIMSERTRHASLQSSAFELIGNVQNDGSQSDFFPDSFFSFIRPEPEPKRAEVEESCFLLCFNVGWDPLNVNLSKSEEPVLAPGRRATMVLSSRHVREMAGEPVVLEALGIEPNTGLLLSIDCG